MHALLLTKEKNLFRVADFEIQIERGVHTEYYPSLIL